MSKYNYTKEEIEELLRNPNVKTCSSKYITFTDDFKLKAFKLDKEGIYHRKIFKDSWFPEYIVKWNIPPNTLKRLRLEFKRKWVEWVVSSKKWRKKKEKENISNMTKDEYIKYLEAKNAYLEELHKKAYWNYP